MLFPRCSPTFQNFLWGMPRFQATTSLTLAISMPESPENDVPTNLIENENIPYSLVILFSKRKSCGDSRMIESLFRIR